MKVLAFEGPHELLGFASLEAAADYLEAIDVDNGEYEVFGDDGTLIATSTRNNRVVLIPTGRREPAELRARLDVFLAGSGVAWDPSLAVDPPALAALLGDGDWGDRPGWLGRLSRRRT